MRRPANGLCAFTVVSDRLNKFLQPPHRHPAVTEPERPIHSVRGGPPNKKRRPFRARFKQKFLTVRADHLIVKTLMQKAQRVLRGRDPLTHVLAHGPELRSHPANPNAKNDTSTG
tara:strand:- start:126 stop:470 length:345 start_codon:yes stop_codon:yes gene_type:complete